MTCKLCGNETDWDNSYGRPKFIVCPSCYKRIVKVINDSTKKGYSNTTTAIVVILEMGYIKEEEEK